MRISEISRLVHEYNLAQAPRRPSMPLLELDDSEMEVFWCYWGQLEEIGVDATNEYLQEALNGNPGNIESAIFCLLEYSKRYGFNDQYHPTNFLAKALREGWKPLSATM